MLAGSIADSKLLQITTAGKVATSALTGTLFRNNSNCCSFNSKYNCWNGVNHFDIFVGALTGNATATALSRWKFWN
jgi:hypothetical protein